jgi:uncharacterized Zn finger protein (UPF0148 family)
MDSPDFLICLNCETPTYLFEWKSGKVIEAFCEACGNEETDEFLTEDDMEALTSMQRHLREKV